MTDEKRVEECKKCECCKLVGKFFFLSGAVFFGTLMALLLAHALTKPQFPPCHRFMMQPPIGIERQLPPAMAGQYGHHFKGMPMDKGMKMHRCKHKHHFKNMPKDMNRFHKPQAPAKHLSK